MRTPTDSAQATTGERLLLALLAVGRQVRSRVGSQLDPASVLVLHHVLESAPLRVSDLARLIRLDCSTVSRHVRNLEELGYLARAADPDDRRATRLRLTDQGRATLDEGMRAKAAIIDRATADWSEEDRDRLTALMTRLAASVDQLTGLETG
jgi:DNA-binding MarR family transcriptional regulator